MIILPACLQMHEGYSELVKGLLEKLTLDHTTSVSIKALAFDPEQDVEFTVCRLLFNQA